MRNLAVSVIVAAILALGGVWWLQGGPTPVPSKTAQSASGDSTSSRAATPREAAPASIDDREPVEVGPSEPTPTPETAALEVLVRVLDFQSRPVAGAGVFARILPEQQDAPRGQQVGTTDEDGVVRVQDVAILLADTASTGVEFDCPIPGLAIERQRIDARSPPPEIVLRLPPSGSIVIRAQQADGTPLPLHSIDKPGVMLTHDREDEGAPAERKYTLRQTLDESATVTFPHVELGAEFLIVAPSFGWRPCAGPRRPGETVEVVLRHEPDTCYVTGRLLDAEDNPVAGAPLVVTCTHGGGSTPATGTTDAEGRFRLWTTAGLAGEEVHLVAGPSSRSRRLAGTWSTALDPRVLVPGDNDLGEVRMRGPEILAAGTVTLDGAAPGSATVRITVERLLDDRWQSDPDSRATVDAEGAFSISGPAVPDQHLRLRITSADALPIEPVECTAGTTDLRVELSSGGTVTATFLVDESVPYRSFRYRLRGSGELDRLQQVVQDREELRSAENLRPAGDGRVSMTWKALPPGTRTLSVVAPGQSQPIVAVEGLDVANGLCEDRRLDGIDLRGLVREVLLSVLDSNGQMVKGEAASILAIDDEGNARGFQLRTGAVVIPATKPLRLWIDVPGQRIAEFHDVFSDRTLRVEPASELPVRLTPPLGRLPANTHLELIVRPDDMEDGRRITTDRAHESSLASYLEQRVRIDDSGRATLLVRRAGRLRVALVAYHGIAPDQVRGVEPTTCTVLFEGGPDELLLRVPDGAIEAALERAK